MNIDTKREEQLAAALCHASAMIPLMGMMVPMAVWFSQRERSPLLRTQALQALAYQIAGILAYFLLYACSMGSMVLMFPIMILGASLPDGGPAPGQSSPQAVLMLLAFGLFFLLMMLFSVVQTLGAPVYVIIALVAGWRVLEGHDFRYPILGRLVARWQAEPAPAPLPTDQPEQAEENPTSASA